MGDCNQCRTRELFAKRLLDELVGVIVDGSRRLIEQEDLALLEKGPRKADELLLALQFVRRD